MTRLIIDIGFLALALVVMCLTLWLPRRSLKRMIEHDYEMFSTVSELAGDLIHFVEDQIRIMPESAEIKEIALIDLKQRIAYMKRATPLAGEYRNKKRISFNTFGRYVQKLQKMRKEETR